MIKKVLILMLLMLPLGLSAQYTAGNWRLHSSFVASQAQNCVDTGEKVYYLVSGCLFCFDKETQENETYTKENYLSDVSSIVNIYYNYTKNYLVIVYSNSNIDFITETGKVVNMPEIKDAIITASKGVTDVTFADNNQVFISTEFGYVVADDSKFVIRESHVYHKSFTSIAKMGAKLVAVIEGVVHVSDANAAHDAISSFVATKTTFANAHLYPINNSKVFTYNDKSFYVGTLGGTQEAPKLTLATVCSGAANNVQPTPTGYMASFMAKNCYYTFDTNGANATLVNAGNEIYSCHPDGNGTIWAIGANGLHINGNESYYKPNAIFITTTPFWAVYNEGQDKVYIHTSSDNFLLTHSADCNTMEVNTYDGQTWRDETPDKIGGEGSSDHRDYSAYPIVVNPKDQNTYFFSTRDRGIYKVTNGKTADIYYATKTVKMSAVNMPGGRYRGATAFDSEGNLWTVFSYSNDAAFVLPSAKVNSTTPVTKNDWKTITIPNVKSGEFKRASFVVGNNDVKCFNDGGYNRPCLLWRDGINTANPTVKSFTYFVDQDGKSVTWTYLRNMAVDKNGHIWIGVNGVIEFDPNDAFSDNFRVNHIKVPRNDGTGLADYLLDGITINCIAVDAQNRKWIGTTTGLFLVSADGTQVLKEFNTSNSLLPNDNIFSIACNTHSNSVYIVTAGGVIEYSDGSNIAPGDLSNVHCYPNPVRPDFTGLMTITGLPDNTLVKIADSAGNVIKQMRSTSGIATWDCCGSDGNRVNTGVYYVLASAANGDSGNNIVAKFLVVK